MPRLEIGVIISSDSALDHIGDSSSRSFIGIVVFYFCIVFILVFISVMLPNPFLQVFLYLFLAGTLVYMEAMSFTEA